MPYTAQQRKLFHAAEENKDVARQHGMSSRTAGQLANEADDLARRGKEKPPTKKSIQNFIDLGPFFGRSDTY